MNAVASCALLSWCSLGTHLTHLAWVDDIREQQGRVYAQVTRWVHGPAPLPEEIPIGKAHPLGLPPPPLEGPRLAVLRFAEGEWTTLAMLDSDAAGQVVDLAAKLSVSGSVVDVNVCGAKGVPVTVTAEAGGRELRRITTTDSQVQFLGLAPGVYMLRATAPGYRQAGAPSPVTVGRCGNFAIRLERYGWREWAGEQVAPAVSLVKAAWMVASEYLYK